MIEKVQIQISLKGEDLARVKTLATGIKSLLELFSKDFEVQPEFVDAAPEYITIGIDNTTDTTENDINTGPAQVYKTQNGHADKSDSEEEADRDGVNEQIENKAEPQLDNSSGSDSDSGKPSLFQSEMECLENSKPESINAVGPARTKRPSGKKNL